MRRNVIIILAFLFVNLTVMAVEKNPYIRFKKESNFFPLAENSKPVAFIADGSDYAGVWRAVENLRDDFFRVTGSRPESFQTPTKGSAAVLVIGTLGKHALIDKLVQNKKLDVSAIKGKWEGFVITVVEKPFVGVERALVIVGSDKRGTIFGIYDLAAQIGVSPWSWWADVPVKKHEDIYFINQPQVKIPKVKYRGIFINDEQPALGGWVAQNYGGFNSKFYEKVFELILRQKGNFLWPAMWGQSFYTEDPENPRLADEMGVVVGTSHHEPMMRAHVEWQKGGGGAWNYNTNAEELRDFWEYGIERMGDYESIVTLAMRGDGDEPMSEDSNIKLLQKIVADQREIISGKIKKPVQEVPQVWALYKEVQEYYDRGMRVPDDVTLLLCDDNWGNIRKLPDLREKPHPGGYGIYYHFDYVGDPRNYKWLNTNPIPRVWEQMHLAWEYGAREIWIVNVGDIKPMEFPIEFFLDYAFDPEAWRENELEQYTRSWAEREFGDHAEPIARMITQYTKFNGRRKPELLGPDSFSPQLYSLANYREAERIVNEYNDLAAEARKLYQTLPENYRDAFYQLVLYPVEACANINELYYTIRLNRLYAKQERVLTNEMADRARILFEKDSLLARDYNEKLSGGKWNHFMDQKRIGYKGWHDDFPKNTIPDLASYSSSASGGLGVAVEGNENSWPASAEALRTPVMDPYLKKQVYVEIFNRGSQAVDFEFITSPEITVSEQKGKVRDQTRIFITVNWEKVTDGLKDVTLSLRTGNTKTVSITVPIRKFKAEKSGFYESDGHVSIDAEQFAAKLENDFQWTVLPEHGRTGSAVTAFPVTTRQTHVDSLKDYVQYDVHFHSAGKFKVYAYFSPTIDFTGGGGLRFGLSFDTDKPRILNLHERNTHRDWQESVKNNIIVVSSEFEVSTPGQHALRFWRVSPGVVLQKIVIDTGGLRPSYLGPTSTYVSP